MTSDIKYLYANFLCSTVEQYINLIAPVLGTFDVGLLERFWQARKLIPDVKPRAVWNRDRRVKENK